MPLSSRTPPAAAKPESTTAFQWTGVSTPNEYYSGLSSRKTAAVATPPKPIAASSGISSRAGEGQTVVSAKEPQPALVPPPTPELLPLSTPGARQQFSTPEEEAEFVKGLSVDEAKSHFGDAWGRMPYEESKKRGALDVWKRSLNPLDRGVKGAVEDFTPAGPYLQTRAKDVAARDKKKQERDQLLREHPEMATAEAGDGVLASAWKNTLSGLTELGLDVVELSGFIASMEDYDTVKQTTNLLRARAGLDPEPEVGSRFGALKSQAKSTYDTVGGFLKSFKEMGVKYWQTAQIKDPVQRKEAMGQWTKDLIDGTAGAMTLGIATKVQNAQGFSSDENAVYYKGEKIRDLTEGEKVIAGAGKTAGSVIGSMVAWKVLSPFAGKQVLKTFPALTPFALKHPYLYQITAANVAEESLQFAVSKTFNIPYTFGDTVTGMMMQFGFESVNLGRAALGKGGTASYDPLGIRGEQARLWQTLPEEMRSIDFDGSRAQLDAVVENFLTENGRIPTQIELQQIVGDLPVPVTGGARSFTYNDLHTIAAKEWMNRSAGGEGESRLIRATGDKEGRPGIDYPAEPPKPGGLDMEDVVNTVKGDTGEVRAIKKFGKDTTAVFRDFALPKSSLEDLLASPPSKMGDLTLDPESIKMAFDDSPGGAKNFTSGVEGDIRDPIQVFYDIETKTYSVQNGYHRLLEAIKRGDEIVKAEVTIGRKTGDSFYIDTKQEFIPPRAEQGSGLSSRETVLTARDQKRFERLTQSDIRYFRENADLMEFKENSESGVKRLRRLEAEGLIKIDESGGKAIVTQEGLEFAKVTQMDRPASMAPKKAATVKDLYGQRLIRSTYKGRPVTTNTYLLEFENIKDEPYLGKMSKGTNLPEETVSKIVLPAESADVELLPYVYRDAATNRGQDFSAIFLRSDAGELMSANPEYINYFRKKFGEDVRFFGQEGKMDVMGNSLTPITVRSAKGDFLGLIMPMRSDVSRPPKPMRVEGAQARIDEGSNLSSRIKAAESSLRANSSENGKSTAEVSSVLRSTKRLMGEGTEKYAKQVEALAARQKVLADRKAARNLGNAPAGGGKGGDGGREPPAPAAAPGGKKKPSGLSSRKKPVKQPKPLEQTQAPRTSRLRERLAKTDPTAKITDPSKANIVKFLQDQFTAPIRTGKFRNRALGIFKPGSNVVRTKAALDLDTAAHEIGHYLDNEYGLFKAVKDGNRYLEPYRAELLRMGEETSRPSYDTKKKIKEGVAEFVRRYVMDPESLDEMAPNFRTFFEKAMPEEGIRLFREARDANAKWMQESPEYRVKSHISTEPPREPLAKRARQTVDAVFAAIDDDMLAIRKYVQEAEQISGKEILYKEDPYVLARLTRGLDGKTLQWIAPNLKPFDGQGRPLAGVRSLGTILNDVGGRRADFESYLVSKRAQDLHTKEIKTGIAPDDADSVVKIMEQRHSDFPKLQREVVGWNKALLQYAQERGFLSSEQVKNMTENGENYVPFFRVLDEITTRGKGKAFADVSSPFKRMKGSTRQIVSPIESMTKNAYVIMSAVDRNRVGQAIVRLARLHPDLGAHIEEIPAGSRPITVNVEEVMKKLGLDGEMSDAAAETITLFVHGNKPNAAGENVMMVVQDGKPKFYSVDPFLYKAIANLNTENASILIKMLAKPASLLRAGATLTPEFMGRNPIRDQFTAFLYSRGNYVPFVDFGRGLMETITKGDDYQRAAIGGAMQASFVSLDRPSLKQYVDGMFTSRGQKIESYVTHPIDGLRALSELGELGTRVGEAKKVFAREFERTGDYEEALMRSSFAARNVTLDFGRKGWAGKTMNMITAFWNATVQDITKFGRELSGREKGANPRATAIKALASLTIPSIAFYEISKHDERYQELPRWQKDYFWILALPGVPLVRIPKPFLPGMLYGALPVRMMEAQEKKSIRPLQDFFVSLRESTMPGLVPTAMLPIIEYATNYSFFFGRQIVPQDELRLLPPDQYGIYTAETYKTLGKALNLSPRKIESLVYGYTAGLGRYASEAMDFIGGKMGAFPERAPSPADVTQLPVIRAFTISDLSTTGQSVSDFYETYTRAEQTYMSFKNAFETQDAKRGREILEENIQDFMFIGPDGNPQMLWFALGAGAETLTLLKQEREKILASREMNPQAKAESIMKINAAMRAISRRSLDATRRRPKSLDDLRGSIPTP